MAIPSTIPNRSSLNTSYNHSDSSSIVEESNDFQKSEARKINIDHPSLFDKPSIEAYLAQLEHTGDAYSILSDHFKKTAEGLNNAFKELEKLNDAHELYLSTKTTVDGNDDDDDDFDGRIQTREDRIQEIVDFIQDSISKLSDLNHITEIPPSTTRSYNNSFNELKPTYPSLDIPRAEFDDSSVVSYASDDEASEIVEEKK